MIMLEKRKHINHFIFWQVIWNRKELQELYIHVQEQRKL